MEDPLIILTGGAGFIGSAFLWKLNKEGLEDIIIVDKPKKDDLLKNINKRTYSDYIDMDDFLDMLESDKFKNINSIIHIGACSSTTETDKDFMMSNNYTYSVRIAKWCNKNNARMIYASSAATYGDGSLGYKDDLDGISKLKPLNIYGQSKQLFDIWIKEHGLFEKFTGFKYFNVFGPNEYHKGDMKSVICKAFKQINDTASLKLFKSYKKGFADGEQKRDFVYIKDVLDVMFFFYENKNINGLYNLGTGKARSFNDLAKATFNAMEKEVKIKYIPMPLTIRDKYQYFTEASLTKLKHAGYTKEFQSLEEGVSDYVKNYLSVEDPYL